jgi:hypothetical protein
LTAVQKRERDAAMAHAEGLLRAPRDPFGGALRKADAPTCLEVIKSIHAGGRGEQDTLGFFAQKLVVHGPRSDWSIDAIKAVHSEPRVLDAPPVLPPACTP